MYSLDKIGAREPLAEEEASITRSVLTLVATGTQVKTWVLSCPTFLAWIFVLGCAPVLIYFCW